MGGVGGVGHRYVQVPSLFDLLGQCLLHNRAAAMMTILVHGGLGARCDGRCC